MHAPNPPQQPGNDHHASAWLGQLAANISPAALDNACFDWLIHLLLSPSKQADLGKNAAEKIWAYFVYTLNALNATVINSDEAGYRCIEPLAQDKRFAAPGWGHWPFNVLSQGFLLNQQWWHGASTGVRGVSQHREDMVAFITRQLLDVMAPSNFMLTNPVVLEETMHSGGQNLMRGAQNLFTDWQRTIGINQPPDASDKTFSPGKNLAITPGKVVFKNQLIELIQYTSTTDSVHAIPVLFVPAWIMKYYILELSPHNSLVSYLVDQGHTVFMISWKNPQAEDRDLTMEDYRQLGVMEAIDAVNRITGMTGKTRTQQLNAVGYCLGGTLLSIAAATMARDGDQRLASISLFASQADFKEPGELSLFIDESQISFLETIMWKQGYLDTTQMAGAFQLLRSNELIWSPRINHYLLGQTEQPTDLMAWNADATRMPYRMHSEYLRKLFLQNDLAEGRYFTDGHPIVLSDIRTPIFAVGTVTDHVAPWHSVFKIHLLCDTDVSFVLTSGGHNAGVVSPPGHPHRSFQISRKRKNAAYVDPDTWQQSAPIHEGSWWPSWESWLSAHSRKRIPPPPMGTSLGDAPGLYVLQT